MEWAANIQLATYIPNLPMVETIRTGSEFHQRPIGHAIRCEDGFIRAPDAPGRGIAFDKQLARAHPYTGTGLHLEM